VDTDRIKKNFIMVGCAVTVVSGGIAVERETLANGNLTSSGYVYPVKVSESDCDVKIASAATAISDAAKFRQLADEWRRDTRYRSNISRAILHPSHIEIVRMDKEVVLPLIFAELRDRGGHWYWALHTLTKQVIGSNDDSLATAKAKWLEWGRTHGYLRS
jgi:hypothetical protein